MDSTHIQTRGSSEHSTVATAELTPSATVREMDEIEEAPQNVENESNALPEQSGAPEEEVDAHATSDNYHEILQPSATVVEMEDVEEAPLNVGDETNALTEQAGAPEEGVEVHVTADSNHEMPQQSSPDANDTSEEQSMPNTAPADDNNPEAEADVMNSEDKDVYNEASAMVRVVMHETRCSRAESILDCQYAQN